jgi:hypothetical protein
VITVDREKLSGMRRAPTSFAQGTHRNLFDAPQTKTNVYYIYRQADPSLRCGFGAARLLGRRVRIPQREWMSLSFECCVLSGRGLCDELITRPEEVMSRTEGNVSK